MTFNFTSYKPFYGRRKGRKLSNLNKTYLKKGKKYLINLSNDYADTETFFKYILSLNFNKIIIEIGFGDGHNLICSAKKNPENLYIGADPYLNAIAKCIKGIIENNISNVMIWPNDIWHIIKFFPEKSVSGIKILFPDPWPKFKHKKRRLIQNDLLNFFYKITKDNGKITVGTDHPVMKSWILETFHYHNGFIWLANECDDWRIRPLDCFITKYEKKSLQEKRKPSWFIFKKLIK